MLLAEIVRTRRQARNVLGSLFMGSLLSLAGCQSEGGAHDKPKDDDYKRYLAISEVRSYYYKEPKTQTKYPLVQGSLTNLGGKKLIVVELSLRFKDNRRNVVYEGLAYPVYVSEFAPKMATKVLGPGQRTRFAFKTPKCPNTWAPGAVDITITKVVFAKNS